MKKLGFIRVSLLIVVIASLSFFINASVTGNKVNAFLPQLSQEELEIASKEANEFQDFLMKKHGFYEQVGEQLKQAGYEYNLLGMIYSKDEIRLKVILKNKEANEQEQIKVKTIFNVMIEKNNLDTKIFKVKIGNDDNPDW